MLVELKLYIIKLIFIKLWLAFLDSFLFVLVLYQGFPSLMRCLKKHVKEGKVLP